jgi:hypothetical protein
LADANESHDWRIWADLAQVLIGIARPLYAGDPIDMDLNDTVYALDSTTIDLCLSLFPWARFRAQKAAVKLHTLLDLRGSIPTFIYISNGKVPDVKVLDEILPEAGSFYVMDRGYLDFKRLYVFVLASAYFVTRTKKNVKFRRRRSLAVVPGTGVISDHIVVLVNYDSAVDYPDQLRRVRFRDPETGKLLVFLTNNFDLPAFTIAKLYKARWRVELFFKWVKQHLRIKTFFGQSENAVKTQIWIAIITYLLVAIMKKRLGLDATLYQILQVLSVSLFEKTPIFQALQHQDNQDLPVESSNQLKLLDL